jgi:ankyrin repeat protein
MPKLTVLPITPKEFTCPITQEIMSEPVATADGQIYEKAAIKKWLENNNKSPLTNLALANKNLIPIPLIKNQIQGFLQTNRICTEKEFLNAVKTGNPDEVEKLNYLDKYLHYSKVEFDGGFVPEILDGGTGLFHAVKGGHIKMVEYLLKNGANPNDFLLSSGWTVLQEAVSECGRRYFAEKNLDTNNNNLSVRKNNSIIHEKYLEIIRLLLVNGADPNKHDFGNEEMCPIIIAAYRGLTEIVSLLIEFKADLEVIHFAPGHTILHIAARDGNKDMVNMILQHTDAYRLLESTNIHKETPLHLAARNGHKEIVAILLADGANYKALNANNKTPVQVALEADKNDIAEAIPLMHRTIKRLTIKNATKIIQFGALLLEQQEEINQLKDQLQKISAQLNIPEVKPSSKHTPKLFV